MEFEIFNKKIRITHSQVQIFVLILGVLLILFPLTVAVFKIQLDEKLGNDISTWVMLGAAALFFWSRKIKNQEDAEAKKQKEADAEAAAADDVTEKNE